MINVQVLRNSMANVYGKVSEEFKVQDGIWFYLGNKRSGYAVDLEQYPNMEDMPFIRIVSDGRLFACTEGPVACMQLIWIYPEIIDSLKKRCDTDKSVRKMSKREYREQSLTNARKVLEEKAPEFLKLYPEAGKRQEV